MRNVMRVADMQRSFTTTFGIPPPSGQAIQKMVEKLDNNYTLQNLKPKRSGRKRSTRSFENTTMILESVTDIPKFGSLELQETVAM